MLKSLNYFSESNGSHPNRFDFVKDKIILRSESVDTDPDAKEDPFRQENKFRYQMTKVSQVLNKTCFYQVSRLLPKHSTLKKHYPFFPPCSLPISSFLPWALTPQCCQPLHMVGTMLIGDLACRAHLFRISSFQCREKDTFDFCFGRFCDWSRSIFQRFKVKLKCEFILSCSKKSWHVCGSNESPAVHALSLS